MGGLITSELEQALNPVGAYLVVAASLVAALFLTTRFSFTATHALLRAPLDKLDPMGRAKAGWSAWREKHTQQRLRKRICKKAKH